MPERATVSVLRRIKRYASDLWDDFVYWFVCVFVCKHDHDWTMDSHYDHYSGATEWSGYLYCDRCGVGADEWYDKHPEEGYYHG